MSAVKVSVIQMHMQSYITLEQMCQSKHQQSKQNFYTFIYTMLQYKCQTNKQTNKYGS